METADNIKEGGRFGTTERDVLLRLGDHENKLSELSRRVSAQEENTKALGELSLSVRELAVTMKSMVREQISHSERITRLERAPLARYETVMYALISALAGGVMGFLFNLPL